MALNRVRALMDLIRAVCETFQTWRRTHRAMQPPWEGGGVAVERGNLPNSERCGGSRLMTGGDTHTITPPLRREWLLTCQGLVNGL